MLGMRLCLVFHLGKVIRQDASQIVRSLSALLEHPSFYILLPLYRSVYHTLGKRAGMEFKECGKRYPGISVDELGRTCSIVLMSLTLHLHSATLGGWIKKGLVGTSIHCLILFQRENVLDIGQLSAITIRTHKFQINSFLRVTVWCFALW